MTVKRWLSAAFVALVLAVTGTVRAGETYVVSKADAGSFPVVAGGQVAGIYVDSKDWPGVIRAAGDLKTDLQKVGGHEAALSHDATKLGKQVIFAGTLGKGGIIDDFAKSGKIDVKDIAGKWESFLVQVVANPLPGVESGLVIAGSDKRGTIFGIYDLSEQMGVSPWYWWADVPVMHRDAVYVKPGRFVQGEPSVKYRGVFINDEAPDLTNWVREKYGMVPVSANPPIPQGVANYNHEFYAHIFEVLLRLKANYLWPAMWNNAFNEDDPENPRLADEYGIVMGTSHQEPMLRAQKEWDHRNRQSWNYFTDAQSLQNFWREGIRRNKNYESILTLGLRGANDTPMIRGGTMQQSMDLLKEIVAAQRKMIAEELNPDVSKVPQLWCPYKEVLDYYNAGLRVPDDVTLLWTDDNWGNLRRLPTEEERKRSGGAGVYYHFDYVGGPRNYKWINTNPISKVGEQMTLAKDYGADRIWIGNVGHFKGLELPIEYLMKLGWNTHEPVNQNTHEFTRQWAERQFGPEHATEIADILEKYTKYNGRRKPELLEPGTYSLVNYHEAMTVAAEYFLIKGAADKLRGKLPENQQDAFFELVQFPASAGALVNYLYWVTAQNALFAQQGRASTNDLAREAGMAFVADGELMDEYNSLLGKGKWNHFMDQVHIGYTTWQDPPRNVMPRVSRIEIPEGQAIGVAIEGSTAAWPKETAEPVLPSFDALNRQIHDIEIFNKGTTSSRFSLSTSASWIQLKTDTGTDLKDGSTEKDTRVWVSIDWDKAPKGNVDGSVTISRAGGEKVNVKVKGSNPTEITRETLDGFAEGEGYVSMEAEHFTKNMPGTNGAKWQKIEDYGRTLSGMGIVPVTSKPATPGKDAPCLEYKMYLFDTGNVNVLSVVGPTLNFLPGRGLSYAVSFDDEAPQTISIVPANFNAQNGNREWEDSVRNNCRIVKSTHNIAKPGYHTLKIWMVDPAVVLEKIVVDLGGVKPCYLGPPESYRATKAGQ